MADGGTGPTGVARLDGLMEIGYPPDADLEIEIEEALRRLAVASPVHLSVARERGSLSIMPDSGAFPFKAGAAPAEALLPAIRDLVETIRHRSECRVESSLRIQEFLGDTVREGVFVHQEGEGVTVAARERPIQPDERPELPTPSLHSRAESFIRKHTWPLVASGAVIAILVLVGLQLGWWGGVAGSVEGPSVAAGPLEGVVEFERVRWRKGQVVFEVRPGPEFDRLLEVGKACSLRPGLFRVVLVVDGSPNGHILPLDLSELPERAGSLGEGETVRVEVRYGGSGFDEVWICR